MTVYVVFLPLIGALLSGLGCRRISDKFANLVTSSLMLASAILSTFMFYEVTIENKPYLIDLLTWLDFASLNVNWSIKIDSLTAVMLIVVTYVSTLVHIYSIGYMSHDPSKQRFMSYLSLFTFFMLLLVTADNFVQLFLGWEGVGLCSYLLIGFWYHKQSATSAAMKAFVVNRVGDFAFAIGIFTIYLTFNSLQFDHIFPYITDYKNENITILGYQFPVIETIGILLFIGSMGKSAQIGLHTWLPDAMEGPTPVSALIHAATMVTAGVFLVARCSPLFEYAPCARTLITIIGAITCLFAATIAITQQDIKKIIAYSTCSQLGYMFFACGVSAYSAAVFHLMTHAFFKALLFLGAGSVIHAMSDEQNINRMGGIWKKIPYTYTLMWIGSLALAGVYPFAGYFSKDIILEAAYASDQPFSHMAYYFGILAAFFTAFYSWRLIIKVFHGKFNNSEETLHHIHESPPSMMLPLCTLAVGALFAGIIGDKMLGMVEAEGIFWKEALFVDQTRNPLHQVHELSALVKLMPSIAGVAGIMLAYLFYYLRPSLPEIMSKKFRTAYNISFNKYYFDEIYDKLIVNPFKCLAQILWKIFDIKIIDDLGPNGASKMTQKFASYISKVQSGYLYHYAFVMLAAVVGFLTWYILNVINY